MSSQSETNFWKFFYSTVLSIIGMDLYLFTHGWYLMELGASKLSIGASWAIFFLPAIAVLPACGRLLEDYSVKKIQLSFEVAKAVALFAALVLFSYAPSVYTVYVLSGVFGLLFCPFYPATYALLKELFVSHEVVKFSNIFEVSLQLAGAVSLFVSGFIYEKFGFKGIVFSAALAVTASCFFLMALKNIKVPEKKTNTSWIKTYTQFFVFPKKEVLLEPNFLFGIFHQIPQSVILLSNITVLVYVSQVMNAGPKVYGYIDALYALAGLAASMFWTRHSAHSTNKKALLSFGLLGAFSFMLFSYFPEHTFLPYLYTCMVAISMTSTKLMSRGQFIKSNEQEFIKKYTPFFQLISNLTLVLGSIFVGYLLKNKSVSAGMNFLSVMMLVFFVAAAFTLSWRSSVNKKIN